MKRQEYHRRRLLKDWISFQCKLFLDWLRDLVFTPLALICMLVDLVTGADEKNGLFYSLLRFGALTDRWIDMFNQHQNDDHHRFDHLIDKADEKWRERQRQK